ncbi:hypothetical protein GL4_2046 [Methyloceanibacter caenitepidi]|uniref:Uncharacterized protein n=1 Tax=Methyloceanibacter caenitepidi TaxID=1384459 RepID=A0A0A8K4M1_9HYPH|nr:hypothetical protein GL4_2046 [Methyloceanibacter caenitepidi]
MRCCFRHRFAGNPVGHTGPLFAPPDIYPYEYILHLMQARSG